MIEKRVEIVLWTRDEKGYRSKFTKEILGVKTLANGCLVLQHSSGTKEVISPRVWVSYIVKEIEETSNG